MDIDNRNVIKLNDAVYYATWLEFFNSIVLLNLIFPKTNYQFLGFHKENGVLFAVLKQLFIKSESQVELGDARKLLAFNDFENYKRNDYVQREWGLILEDMHDQNVLINSDTLFFIDTVFYTVTPEHLPK